MERVLQTPGEGMDHDQGRDHRRDLEGKKGKGKDDQQACAEDEQVMGQLSAPARRGMEAESVSCLWPFSLAHRARPVPAGRPEAEGPAWVRS